MPEFTLPSGLYFSVQDMVRARFGGQTRAHLMRNRFFTQYAGVPTTTLAFDAQPVYTVERERLTARGELVPGMTLRNLYEDYREQQLVDGRPLADALPSLGRMDTVDVPHPDGTVYYTAYREPETERDVVRDYRRADGTVFLRAPGPEVTKHKTPWTLTDARGRPVHTWSSKRGWGHHWLLHLVGDAPRAFLIGDSRQAMVPLLPMPDERFHALQLFHNVHTTGERWWSSEVMVTYRAVLDRLDHLDGLVTLTHRQRADIEELVGRRSNLYTVSNPVTLPTPPEPLPARDPELFTIVSRFETQKRLDHAVRAFALVAARRPGARLRIYGEGALRPTVEALVDELGLREHVELRGWDPEARDTLWGSSGFLVSSGFEGYPLATLESLARGCPVVSYDIKYGPREQIDDGVDGFLVPPGDQAAMADRVVQLYDDPALVARMSEAARQKAAGHDHRAFMRQWSEVLAAVVERRAARVRLDRVTCAVETLGYRPLRLPERVLRRLPPAPARLLGGPRGGAGSVGSSRRLRLEASVKVTGSWPTGALKKARWTLTAVSPDSETVTRLPLQVERSRSTFRLRSTVDLGRALPPELGDGDRSVTLRLRLVVGNAAWQTTLARPADAAPPFEVGYQPDGTLVLQRHPPR